MESCWIDFVGLDYCAPGGAYEQPPSGLYINTLPGISIESLDKIANDEQVTYVGVWNDAQMEAAIRFRTDFITVFTACFELSRKCDYDELICNNRELLVNAWRYLLGNQLMIYRIHSSRLNRFTTIDRDQAKELRDFYQVEYEKLLQQQVKLIKPDDDCDCSQCGGNPQTVYWLP